MDNLQDVRRGSVGELPKLSVSRYLLVVMDIIQVELYIMLQLSMVTFPLQVSTPA